MTAVDRWIRMVAVNRLTGHSTGFFSVYTLPPNQAVSVPRAGQDQCEAQSEPAAAGRAAHHPDEEPLAAARRHRGAAQRAWPASRDSARIVIGASSSTPSIDDNSVALAVTSPPFLDVVDYKGDNWLRCWFSGIDAAAVPVTHGEAVGRPGRRSSRARWRR